ncbi:18258_t:CDS:2, partial [Racocetra persica]
DKLNNIPTAKLFSVDVTGDLEENRSKIPEVFSKQRPNYGKNHTSKHTKMVLDKLAVRKYLCKNSNNTESSEAIMKTGEYDVWAQGSKKFYVFMDFEERKIKPPQTLNMKPAVNIPAVHLPHCGSSYMPSFKDHQELLMMAHEVEVVKLKQMQRINSKLPYSVDVSSALNNECAEHEKKMIERTKLAEEVKKMPKKKFGKYRVRKAPVDVKLTEDLEGTLRLLKPEGNLFRDRMISYEERNIIEPRVPVSKKRKYKLK